MIGLHRQQNLPPNSVPHLVEHHHLNLDDTDKTDLRILAKVSPLKRIMPGPFLSKYNYKSLRATKNLIEMLMLWSG